MIKNRLRKTVLFPHFVVITTCVSLRSVRDIEILIPPKRYSGSIHRLADWPCRMTKSLVLPSRGANPSNKWDLCNT